MYVVLKCNNNSTPTYTYAKKKRILSISYFRTDFTLRAGYGSDEIKGFSLNSSNTK